MSADRAPELVVAFNADSNYMDGLAGTLAGVARAARGAPLEAVVLDCGITDADWAELHACIARHHPHVTLRRVPVDRRRLAEFNPVQTSQRLNNSVYARLLLAELVPDRDRVLYLDSDIYVDADLRPLFRTDLGGALVGAVPEEHLPFLPKNLPAELLQPGDETVRAFNSGVMLMDLAAIRGSAFAELVRRDAATCHDKFQDQAMLNHVLRQRWKVLPARWNRQRFITENFSYFRDHRDSVWHFIGAMKPWHYLPGGGRGLVDDFQRDLQAIGWRMRHEGRWRPHSPAWRDAAKNAVNTARRWARSVE